jgi:hypothetical protein
MMEHAGLKMRKLIKAESEAADRSGYAATGKQTNI